MFSSIILTSFLFMIFMHPSQMVICLCSITLFLSLLTSILLNFSFMGYILALVSIGGLMILFMYMASLSPNLSQKLPPSNWLILMILLITLNLNSFSPPASFSSPLVSVSFPSLVVFAGVYLLITLFLSTQLVQVNKGPLRSN